jgi:hypothetical protein
MEGAALSAAHLGIIQRRKEVRYRTLQARRDYNRAAREQGSSLRGVRYFRGLNCPTFGDYIQNNQTASVYQGGVING